jgi:hypothetical protein
MYNSLFHWHRGQEQVGLLSVMSIHILGIASLLFYRCGYSDEQLTC